MPREPASTTNDRGRIIAEIKHVLSLSLSPRQCSHVLFRAAKHSGGTCTIQRAISWYIADVERLRSVKKLTMHLRYLLNAKDKT